MPPQRRGGAAREEAAARGTAGLHLGPAFARDPGLAEPSS